MWSGNPGNHNDETTRRLAIEMAIGQHTGARAPSYYPYEAQSEYQRRLALQSMHPDYHHPAHLTSHHLPPPPHHLPPHHQARWDDIAPKHGSLASAAAQDESEAAAALLQQQSQNPPARGKPEVIASAARLQEKYDELAAEDQDHSAEDAVEEAEVKKETPGTTGKSASKKKRKRSPTPKPKKRDPSVPTMDDPIKPITAAEYENLQELMEHFCRVPLLAEFSRPVSLLHPEVRTKDNNQRILPFIKCVLTFFFSYLLFLLYSKLVSAYSKIVHHPVDLGTVCRKIRRRQYTCLRDVRLDAWRIFSNCVKYHSHPSNKEAVPSFVSIALHLRNYFNDLWQEHMIPSDPPLPTSDKPKSKSPEQLQLLSAVTKRTKDRKKRMIASGLSVMTGKTLGRAAQALTTFIENGGCVDRLDTERVWGDGVVEEDDLDVVVENLMRLKDRLSSLQAGGDEYGVDELDHDVRKCYTEDVLENNPATRMRVANRLDRFLGKIIVPIHEATCRGVSQSSIWGCMAAAVWARESSKKPYWPAIVLGIMAPDDQKEDWHQALTERNEARLPEKLRTQLAKGKRTSELAIKRQNLGQIEPQSHFLIEFLGTHEFIWIKESDIVENFDPNDDPNQHPAMPNSKKKRASRSSIASITGSKLYESAIEEGKWALEEFELQLQDTGSDGAEDEDAEEMNYSYSVLCQSDEEADEEMADEEDDDDLDVDECNELLATDGFIDFTSSGRKNAKKRAQAMKKQKANEEKKQKLDKVKKLKAQQSKKKKDAQAKEREWKKEQKDLEKRRKKRSREREKALKGSEQKSKKGRLSDSEDLKKSASGRRNLIAGKRERAIAIVEGYLKRATDNGEYKTLCLGGQIPGGSIVIPASLIDSSGIFGMALAFRAAAGEIEMPSESGDQQAYVKPWDAIKVEGQKKAQEREKLLEKKIELLEKAIERVKSNTAKRLELAKEAKGQSNKIIEKVVVEDKNARQNPLAKKKKAAPENGNRKRSTSLDSLAQENTNGNSEASGESEVEAQVDEAMADATVEADAKPVETAMEH